MDLDDHLRQKSGPRNSTHTKQSLRHPWYLPHIYHGLELGVYIRGTTGDKSIYKLPSRRSITIVRKCINFMIRHSNQSCASFRMT